jgi:ribosomal protein S6
MYESAAAIALDETTAQVAKVRKKLKARLADAEAEIEKLRAGRA